MSKQKLQVYVSNEAYQKLLALWYTRRSKDRKTTMSDIVEQAIMEYDAANKR